MARKPIKKKAPSGTLGERLGEARNRPYKGTKGGLPERTDRYSKGTLNKARTPDSIKMGGPKKPLPVKPKTVPLGERPKLLSGPKVQPKVGIGGMFARGLYRTVGGPAAMLVSMTVPAGEGSDKPSGKLFSPSKNRAAGRGNPKTVNPYRKPSGMGGGSKMANSSQAGIAKPKISMAGGGVNKPNIAKDKMKRQLQGRKPDVTPSAPAQASKVTAPAVAKKPAFKGNWTGAAPSEMQKRGGAKIKRPNLLSLFRKKG